jgi:hypothetical protein
LARSWALTLASTILLVVERRKNDTTKYYMVLQAILRACHMRAGFLSTNFTRAKDSERAVAPREEFILFLESEYVNHVGLQEHIMGSMKSLQPTLTDLSSLPNLKRIVRLQLVTA